MQKAEYQTKQMAALIAYLKTVEGIHVTVNDIDRGLKQRGISLGTATIYRNLDKLAGKGLVAKYVIDGASGACFEYIGRENHCHKPVCYHCKCEKCGRLIHLNCQEVTALEEHIFKEHSFSMNSARTVFYGICEECRKKENLQEN